MRSNRMPSRRLTFEDAVQVHLLLMEGVFQSRIAARFDTNSGRVSEIKTGKRHPGSLKEALKRKH